MSLTSTAVKRPIGTAMIYLSVVVIGLAAMRLLSVDLLPSVDFPRISIVTQYPGVGPEEMETLITRPIEQTVSTVDGLTAVDSQSAEGISRIQLQFGWGTNLETAVNDVRAFLDRLGNRLPDDADRPVVYKFDISSFPVAQVGVSGGGDPRRLRYLAEDTLGRRLERLEGVASVGVLGGRVREIRVELETAKLAALNISPDEVVQALARDNRNVSAGDMLDTGLEVLVRAVGEWKSAREIEDVLVAQREGRPVYVRELGAVRDSFQEIRSEQWVDGAPGLVMRISKQSGANTVDVVRRVEREIERINAEYGGRVRLNVLEDSATFIEASVANVQASALYGAALAILVLLVFLRNLRATFVIALAIPISVITTFALMYFAEFTLNVVSFGGLALGIGMLVDNAIVILENIYAKREQGLPAMKAAVEGAREVVPAVVAGTLTTIVVFAPVVFIAGFAGMFFKEMAAVVAFSLLCSLAVAVTLVPSVSARLLASPRLSPRHWRARVAAAAERPLLAVERAYGRFVSGALRTPWLVVGSAALLLAISTRLLPMVGVELMPETDEGQIDIDAELAVGTPLSETRKVIKEVERRVQEIIRPDELKNMLTSAGPENWWRPGGSHQGSMEINLVPVAQRERPITEIMAEVRKGLAGMPGVQIRLRQGTSNFLTRLMRGRSGERLSVEIRGHDIATADRLAQEVARVMRSVEGVSDAKVERDDGIDERSVRVDARRAADVGLTRSQVADVLETFVLGRVATRLRDGGDEFDVRVQLREQDRQRVEQLAKLPVQTPGGGTVPLGSVALIERRAAPASIARVNQERVTSVNGGLGDRPLDAVVADLREALQGIAVPDGFSVNIGGEFAEQQDTFGGLATGGLLAVFLVFMVMAVQFESLKHPLVVMASVPFAFIGVVISLLVTDTSLNINSFLGVIVLVGIVVNNAIVLVDYVNLLRRERGLRLRDALVEAAQRRLRPIIMTTSTTVLAMIPLAMGVGEGSELQAPLARVVVGGLLSSTLVTLLLVPCLYYVIERRAEARSLRVAASSPAGPLEATGS